MALLLLVGPTRGPLGGHPAIRATIWAQMCPRGNQVVWSCVQVSGQPALEEDVPAVPH